MYRFTRCIFVPYQHKYACLIFQQFVQPFVTVG